MRLRITILTLFLIALLGFQSSWAQGKIDSYRETRKWLLKVDRQPGNRELRKLFEKADTRMPDLLRALDDPQKEISVNAQVIIMYLAAPKGLAALEKWYRRQNEQGKGYYMPKIELLSDEMYLEGQGTDYTELVLKNKQLFEASRFNSGDITVKLIAYNEGEKAALLAIIQGQIFTAGWHAVIKGEGARWRLVSDNNVWVH
jgi:hypothetical protein